MNPRAPGISRTSHADLVRAFAQVPEDGHEYVASLCGFVRREEALETPGLERPEPSAHRVPLAEVSQAGETPTDQPVRGTMRFMAPATMEFRDSREKAREHWLARAEPISQSQWRTPRNAPLPPPKAPLMPWSRLWPFLHRAQSLRSEGPSPALRPLVAALARLAPPTRIPRVPVWRWLRGSWILFDFRDALFPFHDDMLGLLDRWRRLFGAEACVAISCRSGEPPHALPPPGTPVLYLGDFGMLENKEDPTGIAWERGNMRSWVDYARRLRRRGCAARALVPCPRERWDPAIASAWTCAYWSESEAPPPVDRGRAPLAPEPARNREALEQLTTRAAPAVHVEMALLRALRRLLPRDLSHPGVEYDFFHACSRVLSVVFLPFEAAEKARPRFRKLDPEIKRAVVRLLRRHHADCAEVIRARETLLLADCEAEMDDDREFDQALRIIQSADRALLELLNAGDVGAARRDGFDGWQQSELECITERTVEEVAAAWKMTQKLFGNETAVRPQAIADQDLTWLEVILNEFQTREALLKFHRVGGQFRRDPPLETNSRTPAFVLPTGNRAIEVAWTPEQGEMTVRELDSAEERVLENADAHRRIELRSDRAILTLEGLEPPEWATRFGWDRFGLFADFSVNGVTFPLRWVPPGEFMMGSPEDEPGRFEREGPQHQVTISHGFWLGETPVTQGQYAAVMGDQPSKLPHAGDEAPAENVSWDACQKFCQILAGQVTDLDPELKFRLPSEAEWEYACRAGTTTALYTGPLTIQGNNGPELDAIAWYVGNSGVDSPDWRETQYKHTRPGTHPVKQKDPNPWGLYDMLGNVWEWCQDTRHDSYEGAPVDGGAWCDQDAGERVDRGGSWGDGADHCRAAFRGGAKPDQPDHILGFRLVLAADVAAYPTPQIPRRGSQPPWATRSGRDGSGVFADFSVDDVTFPLRWIPPGEFMMGSPEDEPGRLEWEGPQHRVAIPRGFWLGATPVTQGQYAAVTGDRPSEFRNAGDEAPVEQVSWDDCQKFCEALVAKVTDFDPELEFRLPSEAEWEYACRAGTATALYTGPLTIKGESNGPELDPIAWYGGNSAVDYEGGYDSSDWPEKRYEHTRAGTHPVGQKLPNPWGLYDMLGNVWEWCEDVWHDSYEGAPTDGRAWGGEGELRVYRGGSWALHARRCRCASRGNWPPGVRYFYLGFRLVLAARDNRGEGPSS